MKFPRSFCASVICFVLAACASPPSEPLLDGTWKGIGRTSGIMEGPVRIAGSKIFFLDGSNKVTCQANFEITEQGNGNSYPDRPSVFHNMASKRSYSYVKIRLSKNSCNKNGYLLFAFPADAPASPDVVEYDGLGRPKGWLNLEMRGNTPG